MTKAEIVATMAKEAKVPKRLAAKSFTAAIHSVAQALKRGERITVVGFGTFFVVHRKARTFKNPRTEKITKLRAKKVPRFSAGTALMAAINGRRPVSVK